MIEPKIGDVWNITYDDEHSDRSSYTKFEATAVYEKYGRVVWDDGTGLYFDDYMCVDLIERDGLRGRALWETLPLEDCPKEWHEMLKTTERVVEWKVDDIPWKACAYVHNEKPAKPEMHAKHTYRITDRKREKDIAPIDQHGESVEEEHSCGGPQEACCQPGCEECGYPFELTPEQQQAHIAKLERQLVLARGVNVYNQRVHPRRSAEQQKLKDKTAELEKELEERTMTAVSDWDKLERDKDEIIEKLEGELEETKNRAGSGYRQQTADLQAQLAALEPLLPYAHVVPQIAEMFDGVSQFMGETPFDLHFHEHGTCIIRASESHPAIITIQFFAEPKVQYIPTEYIREDLLLENGGRLPCEVCHDGEAWMETTLLGVTEDGRFITLPVDNGVLWAHCRIDKRGVEHA